MSDFQYSHFEQSSSGVKASIARDTLMVRRLIWLYFFLLIFEGVLRKWILPSLANPLLLIRDPVVLAAYFFAWRSGIFPRNIFVTVAAIVAFIATLTSFLLNSETPAIALYGFRTNYFQLPFIFLIAKCFNRRDVERVGYWVLIISIPMAVLMALQYLAPSSSFLNAGAGEGTSQIRAAMGHIRPAGTFSFITGPTYFYALVTAILLYSQFGKRYSPWLIFGATIATMCAAALSGSRSLVSSIAVVFLFALLCSAMLRPQLGFRFIGSLIVLSVIGFFLSQLSIIEMGLTSFSQRVSDASASEGGGAGFIARVVSNYTDFTPALYDASFLGQGLGMGTNVGLSLMVDKTKAVWFEDEWARHVLESGPWLGVTFILYRVFLTAWVGFVAVRHAARYNPLSALIFGAVFLSLLNGSLGQTTSQGFIILQAGLCLAAIRMPKNVSSQAESPIHTPDSSDSVPLSEAVSLQ